MENKEKSQLEALRVKVRERLDSTSDYKLAGLLTSVDIELRKAADAISNTRGPSAFPYWAPIATGLPERDGEYIIASSTGYITTCEFNRDRGWTTLDAREGDDYWNRFVTHWMPLPEAPK